MLLQWAKKSRLGVVLDCHQFEGANFLPRALHERLFTDPKLQEKHANLWRQIAEYYRSEGRQLRFDLLNEAVTSDSNAVNLLMERAIRSVRRVSADRVLYVTGNNWSQFRFAKYIKVYDDPNIIYVFHYYGLIKHRPPSAVNPSLGFMSSSEKRLHFGLGKETRIRSVEVRRPSGKKTTLTDVAPDKIVRVEEPR